jgi:hypothetical protein
MTKKENKGYFKLTIKSPDGETVNEFFDTKEARDKKAEFYKKNKIKTKKA